MDRLVAVTAGVLVAVIVVSWMATLRTAREPPAGSSLWFGLPALAQLGLGLGSLALTVYLGYLLWIPLPLALPAWMASSLRALGLGVYLGGLGLALWARWSLGEMYGVSTSSATQLQVNHQLIQRGPYAGLRHPMYLGYWLLFAGVLLIYRTWTPVLLLAIFVPAFCRRARREETALEERFGQEWIKYKAHTGFMIPFV
ncbi:MAG: hypothetical protein A2W34_00840 [Chloroflexi bacterium RBG_16_64_32]|nr:MAG: hypothetical protein A2W34_00840 [Chloroflexi bacterium RBG_16_64_32]